MPDHAAPTKYLILNADDFGATETVNAAVARAHADGVLTSASLMVAEPAADRAVALAREFPRLGVGLHVVMSDGRAVLPVSEAPYLVQPDGRFRDNPARAGLAAYFSRPARREAAAEIAAQFARFARTGLTMTHVDGHQHLHMHPVLWDAILPLAVAHGAGAIRMPCEEFRPISPGRRAARRMEWLFFRLLAPRCRRTALACGIRVMDRVYGHLETGRMTEAYLLNLLPRLAGRTNEVYLHPGTLHAQRLPDQVGLDVELHALVSGKVRAEIGALGLCRSDFASLPGTAPD